MAANFCPHQSLTRANTEANESEFVYQCNQCRKWCNTAFFFVERREEISTSRLENDFELLGGLGRGGFGEVAKFRNKKDEQIYAIKKTEATELNEREVKVFSTFKHENIVRYYTCWSEPNDSAFPKMSQPPAQSLNTSGEEWFQKNICKEMEIQYQSSNENNHTSLQSSKECKSDTTEEASSADKLHDFSLPSNNLYKLPELVKPVLYIQMEFCEKKTLREAINSGDLIHKRYRMWKLARQMVEGISYIHSRGVTHRDLKPENIFLSSGDCVKIGDFGLARSVTWQQHMQLPCLMDQEGVVRQQNRPPSSVAIPGSVGSLTYGPECGTYWYMAPEIINSGNSGTNKLDMYSFGIIFYEMCHEPFVDTGKWAEEMEKIRQPNFTIPPPTYFALPLNNVEAYEKEKLNDDDFTGDKLKASNALKQSINYAMPNMTSSSPKPTNSMIEIINQLLDHDHEKRPSAEELLKSPNMPPPLLDKMAEIFQLIDYLLLRRDSYEDRYVQDNLSRLMNRCLDQTAPERDIYQWLEERYNHRHSLQSKKSLTDFQQTNLSINKIFFKNCQETGAKHFQAASLFPHMSIKGDYKSAELNHLASNFHRPYSRSLSVMGLNGQVFVLPFDSQTSFAYHIASSTLPSDFKRYSVNPIYTGDNHVSGFAPEPDTELAFDIVSPSSTEESILRTSDAEVIKVISNVLKDCKQSSFVLQLSHQLLFKAALVYSGANEDHIVSAVRQIQKTSGFDPNLKTIEPSSWLLSDSSLESFLKKFKKLNDDVLRGNLTEIKNRLKHLEGWNGSDAANAAGNALIELEAIIQNISNFGGEFPIVINLSVALESYDTYSAFCFKCIREPKGDEDKTLASHLEKEKVLAAGGRYDGLVASFRNVIDLIKRHEGGANENQEKGQHVTGGSIYVNELVKSI